MKDIVLFDGVCNLCNGAVQFIIRRDPAVHFQFAALQSDVGRALTDTHGVEGLDSIVLVQDGRVFVKSAAALRIALKLRGLWKVLGIGLIVPKIIRDAVYDWIAAHRYQWFGEQAHCMIPSVELKARFIE